MKPGNCERTQDNLWRYIDRELSAPGLAEISSHLKTCGDCQKLYESRARDANLYRLAFTDSPFGDGFLDRFHRRLAADGADLGEVSRRGQSRHPGSSPAGRQALPRLLRSRPRRSLAQLSLAAALLLIAGLMTYGLWPRPFLGCVEDSFGQVTLVRAGKPLGTPEPDLLAGDRFRLEGAGSRLTIRLKDGSLLRLSGPADFGVHPDCKVDGPFTARLEEGMLSATVEHRSKGRDFMVTSPDGTVVVVGTEFTLQVFRGLRTLLQVHEGRVLFSGDPARGRSVPVDASSGPYEVRTGQGWPRRTEEPESPVVDRGAAAVPPSVADEPAHEPANTLPPAAPRVPRSPASSTATDLPVDGAKKSEE